MTHTPIGTRLLAPLLMVMMLLALAGPGAAGPYREYELKFTGEAPPPLGKSPDDAALFNTIAWLMSNKLDLPFPAGTKAYVYVNEATLVDGLVTLGGEKSDEAWDRWRNASGVATRTGVFLRGDHMAWMALQGKAGLFAHELAHVSQRKLREGGKRSAAVWIAEGHADWVKFQVSDLLGYRPYAESRQHVARTVLGSATPLKLFPDLQTLSGTPSWTDWTRKTGAITTYCQAFLAVDWLIERYGHAKLIEFMGRFAGESPAGGNWGATYPIAYREFTGEFRARLEDLGRTMPPAAGGSLAASRPSCD
jgi:hypothetical protein